MKSKAYLGIDPGASGAICLLVPHKSIIFIDAPYDISQLHQSLLSLQEEYALAPVMVEQVRSLFGMSAKSNFSFGFNVGEIQTVIKCARLGMDLVLPKEWQKLAGIKFPKKATTAQKKKITAERAIELYPDAEIYGPQGGLKDGRSDALMLSYYCMLKYN